MGAKCNRRWQNTFDSIGLKGEILLHPAILTELQSLGQALKATLQDTSVPFPNNSLNDPLMICQNCLSNIFRIRDDVHYVCAVCGLEYHKSGMIHKCLKVSGVDKFTPTGVKEHTEYIGNKISNGMEAAEEIASRVGVYQATGEYPKAQYVSKAKTVSSIEITWDDEALIAFEKVVLKAFQKFVKKAVERKAFGQGISFITKEIFLQIKKESGN